jgi:hypothetical protein
MCVFGSETICKRLCLPTLLYIFPTAQHYCTWLYVLGTPVTTAAHLLVCDSLVETSHRYQRIHSSEFIVRNVEQMVLAMSCV